MPRFFVPVDNISGELIEITGDDANHISRSLRMAAGEEITVCDMRGGEYRCVLESFEGGRVIARITDSRKVSAEPPCKIRLYQAYPKGDKLDVIVQKAVELGVYSITPFESERCVSRPDMKSAARKTERWQRIALEAAKQCGRGIIPSVNPPLSFDEMLTDASLADIPIFCYEGDGTDSLETILSQYKRKQCTDGDKDRHTPQISVVIGSEGGFSRLEADMAKNAGFYCAGLGKRILRCETASGFVLACISYEFEL